MEYQNVSRLSRRSFLFAGFVAAVGRATTYAQQQAPIPETLTQWLGASAKMRKLASQRCLDRIQTMEPSIHAWVQVSPQRNATRGRLSGIPYGVKDIVETRGLATEYGSPIYKGRIGTTDAAIIREMRKHGAILLGKTQTTAFAYQTPAPTRNPREAGPRLDARKYFCVPAGRSVFHLTSPLIGLLAQNDFRLARHPGIREHPRRAATTLPDTDDSVTVSSMF